MSLFFHITWLDTLWTDLVCVHVFTPWFFHLLYLGDSCKILDNLLMDTLYYTIQLYNLLKDSLTNEYSDCFQYLDIENVALQIYHCVTTSIE